MAVIALEYKGFREDRVTISGRRKMPRNQPLILPGGVDTWRVTIGGTGESNWQPYDRFEITGVKWDDGVVEGDAAFAEHEGELNVEKVRQIDRVLSLLSTYVASFSPRYAGSRGAAADRNHR